MPPIAECEECGKARESWYKKCDDCRAKGLNEDTKGAAPTGQVDSIVIRQTLQTEIESKQRAVDRFVDSEEMEAAAHASAERDGLVWALFVLAQKQGV